jgi:hypothetical protein
MAKTPFVTLVFQGSRFGGAAMPLEALPELAAYRDLVLATAKALFQAKNPARQRLPKGFDEGLHLVLEKVEAGSTVPVISRVVDGNEQLSLVTANGSVDLFDQARELVQSGIATGGFAAEALPPELAKQVLARFNSFGRSLGPDESIIVARPGTREGARYTREVRRRLVLQAQTTYEDEVDLVGEVRSADKDADGFTLRTPEGDKIPVRAPPLFFPLALRSLGEAALVRVRGIGLLDVDGNVRRITANEVSLAEEGAERQLRPGCPTPIEQQVEALRALPAGWFDESSPSFDPSSLEWLTRLIRGVVDGFTLPSPYLYPTPEGFARAEWPGSRWEIVANIDLDAKLAEVLAVRLDSDRVDEEHFPLDQPGGESKLGRFLTEHLQAG